MCRTWYLSLPIGTIFAFSIDASASVSKALDETTAFSPKASTSAAALECSDDQGPIESLAQAHAQDASISKAKERKKYIGYIRDLTSSSVSIGLLASAPRASPPSMHADSQDVDAYAHAPRRRSAANRLSHGSIRYGVEVDCEGISTDDFESVSDAASDFDDESMNSPKTSHLADHIHTHPLLAHHHTATNLQRGAEVLFGDTEVANYATKASRCWAYLNDRPGRDCSKSVGESRGSRRASWPTSSMECAKEWRNLNAKTRMTPTTRLPWKNAFAYAPYMRRASASSESTSRSGRKPHGRTRLVVGDLNSSGLGRHSWPRFTRSDVEHFDKELRKTLGNAIPPGSVAAKFPDVEDSTQDPGSDLEFENEISADIPIVIDVQLDVSDVKHLIATPAELEEEMRAVERQVMEARRAQKEEQENREGTEITGVGFSSDAHIKNEMLASIRSQNTHSQSSPASKRPAITPATFPTSRSPAPGREIKPGKKIYETTRRRNLAILPTRTLSYTVHETSENNINASIRPHSSLLDLNSLSKSRLALHHSHNHHHYYHEHVEGKHSSDWFGDGVSVEDIVPVGWVR